MGFSNIRDLINLVYRNSYQRIQRPNVQSENTVLRNNITIDVEITDNVFQLSIIC